MASPQSSGSSRNKHALTERRQAILDFHRNYLQAHGYAPSMREIRDAVGLNSTSAVFYQLKILEEMRQLSRTARRPRTVVSKSARERSASVRARKVAGTAARGGSSDMVSVPLFERIAAGAPVIANQEPVATMLLPRQQVGYGHLFAVKVTGDSMINANIFDGDIVVLRRQNDARDGDVVAALIGDEATVKTLRVMNGHVWLLPQNPAYEPIQGDHCSVMGKVVATIHPI
jgi:repressor LexA